MEQFEFQNTMYGIAVEIYGEEEHRLYDDVTDFTHVTQGAFDFLRIDGYNEDGAYSIYIKMDDIRAYSIVAEDIEED